MKKDLLHQSGLELGRRIKRGQISSEEVVSLHIEHIKKINPHINAVVANRFDEALYEAREADGALHKKSKSALSPFFGVPCTIKENFQVTGMPNASGLLSRKHLRSTSDAPVVSRLKGAGLIPLGVTNTSEVCLWFESNNKVYGRTNNPYNRMRTVGGSSGGEGAIIAACGSPLGLGSDIGGSIRMPAFFNGIFGHKPSSGLVPNTGQFPLAKNKALNLLGTGPLARHAEDLMPLLKIIAGPDGVDPSCKPMTLGNPENVNLKKLHFYYLDDRSLPVTEDLRQAENHCLDVLAKHGATVKKAKLDAIKYGLEIWSANLLGPDSTPFKEVIGGGTPIKFGEELKRWFLGKSPYTFPSIGISFLEDLFLKNPRKTQRFVHLGEEMKKRLEDILGDNGILLFPSHSRPAPVHYTPLLTPFDFVYTALFNIMETPVTQIPLGLNEEGLPLGIQAIGPHGKDHLTLAVAQFFEQKMGGWVKPPMI